MNLLDRPSDHPESDGKEGRESYLARDQETRGKDTETGGGGGGGGKVAVVVDTRGGDSANQVAADWRC